MKNNPTLSDFQILKMKKKKFSALSFTFKKNFFGQKLHW